MKYTKEQVLAAGKLGEVSMIDVRYVVSLLDEIVETTREKITGDVLVNRNGFKLTPVDETYWKDFRTHYIELVPMPDGFYPTIVQLPQLQWEEEDQRVLLPKIEYCDELEDLLSRCPQALKCCLL